MFQIKNGERHCIVTVYRRNARKSMLPALAPARARTLLASLAPTPPATLAFKSTFTAPASLTTVASPIRSPGLQYSLAMLTATLNLLLPTLLPLPLLTAATTAETMAVALGYGLSVAVLDTVDRLLARPAPVSRLTTTTVSDSLKSCKYWERS